jgi:hypothetical protein
MALLIGVILALAVALFARVVGLDRDRSFYPTVLIIIASLYGLFAVMGGTGSTLLAECAFGAAFVALAVVGFKFSPWFLVAGLAAHGVFDLFHGHVIANPGVPAWYPDFCVTYDLTAAVYLAWLIRRRHTRQMEA